MADTEAPRTGLTPQQLIITDLARKALAASEAETDPDRFGRHTGPLEHHVQALLNLVAEMALEKERP